MRNVGGHGVLEKSETDQRLFESFLKLKDNPNDVEALTDIGHCYNVQEKDDLSFIYMKKAVETMEHPITLFNYGLLLRQYGRHEEAFPYVEKAHNAWPHNIFMGHVYAEELIRKGKWLEAWPLCSKYRSTKHYCALANVPEWKGENLNGKRIAVISEGGYGDAIWLYRFLPKLKAMGAYVRFGCQESLASLFDENRIIEYGKDEIVWDLAHPFDYWVSIFELLQWLDVEEPYWPGVYIKANPEKVPAFQRFPKLCRVGFTWSAGEKLDVRKHRSFSDDEGKLLMAFPNIAAYSLQVGHDFQPKDWSETCAFVETLDLVVTVDTSMVHLAGAMGKPTLLVLGGYQDCKYQSGDRTGWYPSVKILRNDTVGFVGMVPRTQESLDNFVRTGVLL